MQHISSFLDYHTRKSEEYLKETFRYHTPPFRFLKQYEDKKQTSKLLHYIHSTFDSAVPLHCSTFSVNTTIQFWSVCLRTLSERAGHPSIHNSPDQTRPEAEGLKANKNNKSSIVQVTPTPCCWSLWWCRCCMQIIIIYKICTLFVNYCHETCGKPDSR